MIAARVMRLKTYSMNLLLVCSVMLVSAPFIFAYQANRTELDQLRKLFIEAVGQDFELVKDVANKRTDPRGGETYWLAHVKPRRSGHYALTYTYKYTHKFSHPEEGENELIIRVGEKNCSRYNYDNLGLTNVCLGDTVIVPIRLDQVTGHKFSLKSTYQDGENIGKTGTNSKPYGGDEYLEQVINPLEEHLKYLGTQRHVMLHRSYGSQTVTYTAFFEAKSLGRFNFAVFSSLGDDAPDKTTRVDPLNALPIIIVKPGTPITALVYHENTISYSDNKRFSGHAGHDFLTKLMILQPGDVFAVEYSRFVENEGLGSRLKNLGKDNGLKSQEKLNENKNRKLVMHKLPFRVNKDWSYNEWLIDYLPVEK